jgi:hypothetical protein
LFSSLLAGVGVVGVARARYGLGVDRGVAFGAVMVLALLATSLVAANVELRR